MRRTVSLFFGLVAVAACETASAPQRMTAYPIDLLGTGLTFHWPSERLPVRYYIAPGGGSIDRLVTDGLAMWERQLLYGEVRGTLVPSAASADVIVTVLSGPPPDVSLTDDPPEPGACSGATGADSLTADNRIVGPLRLQVSWDSRFSQTDVANCLARVVAHEVGHTLGLFGHSPDLLDLMNTNPRVREPSLADRAALQILYHTPPDIKPPE